VNFYREKAIPQLIEHGIEFFPLRYDKSGKSTLPHIHPAIEIIYLTKGRYDIFVDNEHYSATKGDLLLFRSNVIHSLKHTDSENNIDGEYFVLKIDPKLLFQMFSEKDDKAFVAPFISKKSDDISFFPEKNITDEMKNIFNSMICEYNRSDSFFNASIRSLSARLLIEFLRSAVAPRVPTDSIEISEKNVFLIHESLKYVSENFASDITPADCAALVHLSYSYFAKLFHTVTGSSFKEYLTQIRIAKAHDLIISTSVPITEVAISCGYSNLSYFISEYKKIHGKSPLKMRKQFSVR